MVAPAVIVTTLVFILLVLLATLLVAAFENQQTLVKMKSSTFMASPAVMAVPLQAVTIQQPTISSISALCSRIPWRAVCLTVLVAGCLVGVGFLTVWLVNIFQTSFASLQQQSVINNIPKPIVAEPKPEETRPSIPPFKLPDVVVENLDLDLDNVVDNYGIVAFLSEYGNIVFSAILVVGSILISMAFYFCRRQMASCAVSSQNNSLNNVDNLQTADQLPKNTEVQRLVIKWDNSNRADVLKHNTEHNLNQFFAGLATIPNEVPQGTGPQVLVQNGCIVYMNDSFLNIYRRIRAAKPNELFIVMQGIKPVLSDGLNPNQSVEACNIENIPISADALFNTSTKLCDHFNRHFFPDSGHTLGSK